MAFSLASKSTLGESLALVAKSEVETLVHGSSEATDRAAEPSLDERVHETRKSIKRLRALLRLYRGALDHAVYTREDQRLRALGHALGGARDSAALRESLDFLVHRARTEDRARLADAMPSLSGALPVSDTRADETLGALRAVHDELETFASRAAGFRVERSGWSVVAPGLRRTYARGRRALRRAHRRPSEKRLHSLRIAVKRHQYQLALLEPLWPEPIKALRHEVQRLAELLGSDHDLSALERRFETLVERPEIAAVEPPFRNTAEASHAELRREALDIAARVYAESPSRFSTRFREYFDAWR